MLDSFGDGFIAFDVDWRITHCNRAGVAHYGLSRHDILGRVAWEAPGLKDDVALREFLERARGAGASIEAEVQSELRAGRWFFLRAFPLGDGMGLSTRDVTETRRAQERQQLLINELNHRVKNTLATIQSLARQTLREGVGICEARERLTERLLALSAAHNVLTRENWEGADLMEIAAEAMRPYQEPAVGRIRVHGPHARLAPNVALALSMAFHELATNALKHGALSAAEGWVELDWRFKGAAIEVTWTEGGGPPVAPPRAGGFGSRLLAGLSGELGSPAQIAYAASGLTCRLRAPSAEAPGPG